MFDQRASEVLSDLADALHRKATDEARRYLRENLIELGFDLEKAWHDSNTSFSIVGEASDLEDQIGKFILSRMIDRLAATAFEGYSGLDSNEQIQLELKSLRGDIIHASRSKTHKT